MLEYVILDHGAIASNISMTIARCFLDWITRAALQGQEKGVAVLEQKSRIKVRENTSSWSRLVSIAFVEQISSRPLLRRQHISHFHSFGFQKPKYKAITRQRKATVVVA